MYKEQKTRWRESKALGFFLNFIKNHDEHVNDDDTFALIAALRTHEQWVECIRQALPKTILQKMQHDIPGGDRLNFDDQPPEIIRCAWCCESARKKIRSILLDIGEEELRKNPPEKYADEVFSRKVLELRETLKLTGPETDVMLVLAFVDLRLLCIADGHNRRSNETDKAVFVAKSLDCDLKEVSEALDASGRLRRFSCIDSDLDFNRNFLHFLSGFSEDPLSSIFFVKNKEKALPWEFYGSLIEKHGKLLERILSACDGKNSANILLYGAPGTGKTSFAKTLAERLHRDCYLIRQFPGKKGDGCSDPKFRFGALEVCSEQVDPAGSIIVVDEADEMLRGGSSTSSVNISIFGRNFPVGDKGRLNSTLDAVRIPTIWITNTRADELDESSRRRFDYSIRFDPLSDTQRKMIWHNNVLRLNLESLIDDAMQEKFASRYPVSAGGISLVLQNVMKLNPRKQEVEDLVEKLMRPHCELLEISSQHDRMLPAKDYSLSGLNIKGKIPLERIVQAVRSYQAGNADEIDRPRMNLLLAGAPGTGKTEFVKYLGAELNTKVVVKMGSDLLNMYVGGTEQRIRQAFEEAAQEHAILFLDEIDGILQNREHAEHNWEVTQVNELLHRMENFQGIMVGATNFAAQLDPAVLRRFTFKLEFDFLDDAGKKIFFERMFRQKLSQLEEERLMEIAHLTPGDFRTVRQSFFYLGENVTCSDLLDALQRESESKQVHAEKNRRIGFLNESKNDPHDRSVKKMQILRKA